jgi:hypothetical protein
VDDPLGYMNADVVRGAYFDRILHSRMPLDPTHAPLDASMRVTNDIPLRSPLLLPVGTVNHV